VFIDGLHSLAGVVSSGLAGVGTQGQAAKADGVIVFNDYCSCRPMGYQKSGHGSPMAAMLPRAEHATAFEAIVADCRPTGTCKDNQNIVRVVSARGKLRTNGFPGVSKAVLRWAKQHQAV
jgi:hypothetical protein